MINDPPIELTIPQGVIHSGDVGLRFTVAVAIRSGRPTRAVANKGHRCLYPTAVFDPHQGVRTSAMTSFLGIWETFMQGSDIALLIFIVGAFTVFGGVLGWASFEESRCRRGPENENEWLCLTSRTYPLSLRRTSGRRNDLRLFGRCGLVVRHRRRIRYWRDYLYRRAPKIEVAAGLSLRQSEALQRVPS